MVFPGLSLCMIFTFGIGLVFGFSKYKIKSCGYAGVAVAHGKRNRSVQLILFARDQGI
ncbi:MAG: hypothetical protein LKF32_02390 [Mageeibacillus sp.]|jgi:hypothetical protein|nr:hypothetical protein [Mageeibacillus sp.]MCI1264709.1 hypothetical protein [Saccharofermentans sp.]MCI1770039.1 hypothetical protein [Mageeibacillus sp.]MCI2043896.1 hypothetical protein [Mageeibacillus sp.]